MRFASPPGSCLLSLVYFTFFTLAASQDCSKSNPCPKGCCSKFGYCGYGPDFCATEVCVANCEVKSECRADTWPLGYSEKDSCPLNVCCSKFGFCGTTSEFCGDVKIQRPSCDAKSSGSMARVVGYYETWGPRRPCDKFMPESIPRGVYTHINIAFATIEPGSFQVRPANTEDVDLYKRIAQLKEFDPDLKVYLALGGWAFNDPGPTRSTFSDIAGSYVNQRTFFKSLVAFLSAFNFDGVDYDWEYPAADDRGGRPEDFDNFTKFISNLMDTLKTAGRSGLSITLPASYWYLQHFDIKKLQPNVEFFNLMSYDMHGLWDRDNKWTGPWLNAHSNLTEIQTALDLLWRNDIKPDQVVLGLGFYGRAFTATSSSCLTPGCKFKAAGNPGRCSREAGILTISEIMDTVKSKNLKPQLYRDEAVKVISWDDQWVAYDDQQTIEMKAEFARGQCLGGLMVWAITHDMEDGRFSRAVGRAAGRSSTEALKDKDPSKYRQLVDMPQCRWTNCGEGESPFSSWKLSVSH
ncbi:glycoside hydrolase [Trichodelitschia bisporula]|uniref:chitinase n=1 Tax=Trichodelitschia bisporula TaxID=703511 RepID=A0A6G1I4Z4_9PEZI|nr:glycoside hydrolase [Trichodelitschia bisporula]